MPDIPTGLRYSLDHLRARPGASLILVGVTDFAQQPLGDVVDVTVPKAGDTVRAGEACGDIESVKSVSDLIAPVTGTIRRCNGGLTGVPELVNTDPYGQGCRDRPGDHGSATRSPAGPCRLPRADRRLMDYQLQFVTMPVADADQAAVFPPEQAGFTLDVDYHPVPGFRVVQPTPPDSARATYLAVTDIDAACRELARRGVPVSAIRHKSPSGDWGGGWAPGPAPHRRDYASQAGFTGPGGRAWVIQENGYRPPPSSRKDLS